MIKPSVLNLPSSQICTIATDSHQFPIARFINIPKLLVLSKLFTCIFRLLVMNELFYNLLSVCILIENYTVLNINLKNSWCDVNDGSITKDDLYPREMLGFNLLFSIPINSEIVLCVSSENLPTSCAVLIFKCHQQFKAYANLFRMSSHKFKQLSELALATFPLKEATRCLI